jgi:O-antigen ligase
VISANEAAVDRDKPDRPMNRVRVPAVYSSGRPSGSQPGPGALRRSQDARAVTTGSGGQRWSGIALLGILIVTASIGFDERLPVLSVGVTLQIPDILLLGLLGCVAIRWATVPDVRIVRTPLDLPLLVFYGVTLFSTLVAIVHSSLSPYDAIPRIRVFSYYLTFFVVTNLVRDRRQLNLLLNGIFVLATIVAAAMIAQYFLGDSVQLVERSQPGSMVAQDSFGASSRIAPPGLSIVMVTLVTSLCILVLDKVRPMALLRYGQCGLLAMAFLVTFLRSYWAGLIVVVLLMGVLVRGADRRRLIGWGLWGLAVMIPAALVLSVVLVNVPDSRLVSMMEASWDRYSTLGRSGTFQGGDDNVEFRKVEYSYAIPAIEANPVIGLGLGAAYRPLDPRLDGRDADGLHDLSRLIHNGHLMVLLQSGLLGYLSLVWLSFAFLVRGLSGWRNIRSARMRAVVLGFSLVYLALCIAAVGNSTFMQWSWTPVIGIMMGVNEVIFRKASLGEALG